MLLARVLSLVVLAVGIVYLTVECQALPGFLGPVHGDRSPRTGLGIAAVMLGLVALVLALVLWRPRPPVAPGDS
jgi:hypothetical protein